MYVILIAASILNTATLPHILTDFEENNTHLFQLLVLLLSCVSLTCIFLSFISAGFILPVLVCCNVHSGTDWY